MKEAQIDHGEMLAVAAAAEAELLETVVLRSEGAST